MPQLDFVTYLSQFTWLAIFYITLYIALQNIYLPKIARVLKMRNTTTSSSSVGSFNELSLLPLETGKMSCKKQIANINAWVDTQKQKNASIKAGSITEYIQNLQHIPRLYDFIVPRTIKNPVDVDYTFLLLKDITKKTKKSK